MYSALQLMFIPFLVLFFTTISNFSVSSFSLSAMNPVSSAYRMWLRLWPPLMNAGRTSNSLTNSSAYMLNKTGVKTRPCLTSSLYYAFSRFAAGIWITDIFF